MAMLNRWVRMKKDLNQHKPTKKPANISQIQTFQECEYWRQELIMDIKKKFTEIQNASIGEQRIREINDNLNRQFDEKRQFEDRIRELGGPDYAGETSEDTLMKLGVSLPGQTYRYFGVAKELPRVKELFQVEQAIYQTQKGVSKKKLYEKVDYVYLGY